MPNFEKQGPFGFYLRGVKGSFFKLHQSCPQKKLVKGYIWGEIARNVRLVVVLPGDRKLRLGSVLKTSGHACVQH